MNAYSEDLRKKIVGALGRGATKTEAARTFGISRSSVKRYAKLADEGRPSRSSSSSLLAASSSFGLRPGRLFGASGRPSSTLRQRRDFLRRVAGVSVSEPTVSRTLRRLGWSRKKDRWERRSATSP